MFMKVIGLMEKCKGKVNLCTPMKMCMRVNLLLIKQMAMEYILRKVVKFMKVIGSMINRTVRANKH